MNTKDILAKLALERDAARLDYHATRPGSLAEERAHGHLLGLTIATNIAEKILAASPKPPSPSAPSAPLRESSPPSDL